MIISYNNKILQLRIKAFFKKTFLCYYILKKEVIFMIKFGVIAEYNPFHNGHIYHLNKVKEMFPNSYLILILIGNFTQRGDVSVINKWDKTKLALDYGYDLVVELPFNIATSSASVYASGAVKLLNELNCNYLEKCNYLENITYFL